jgi:hypothetical protein
MPLVPIFGHAEFAFVCGICIARTPEKKNVSHESEFFLFVCLLGGGREQNERESLQGGTMIFVIEQKDLTTGVVLMWRFRVKITGKASSGNAIDPAYTAMCSNKWYKISVVRSFWKFLVFSTDLETFRLERKSNLAILPPVVCTL